MSAEIIDFLDFKVEKEIEEYYESCLEEDGFVIEFTPWEDE